jgi:hypothetical protein
MKTYIVQHPELSRSYGVAADNVYDAITQVSNRVDEELELDIDPDDDGWVVTANS